MKCRPEADPWIRMLVAQRSNLRVPIVFQRFSVEALRLGVPLASNPQSLLSHSRCDQRERGPGHKGNSRQRRRLPVIVIVTATSHAQEVLVGERRALRRYTKPLIPRLYGDGSRSVFSLNRMGEDPVVESRVDRR